MSCRSWATSLFCSCALAACLSGKAAAYEYTCVDRFSGNVVGHPISRDQARQLENRNRSIDCERKGMPIESDRDRREGAFDHQHQPPSRSPLEHPFGRDDGFVEGPLRRRPSPAFAPPVFDHGLDDPLPPLRRPR